MDFHHLVVIIISAIFVNNFVLSRFLGLCPFIGVSKKVDAALGMGMAVIFVMTMASLVTWMIQYFILAPLGLTYLRTIAFILTIATLVQFVEMVIQKMSPNLYNALGIYLPLITTNCAVLGVAILNISGNLGCLPSLVQGAASGVGFTLALILMAGIRQRLEVCRVPRPLEGLPIAFIVAGLMSIAFLGFAGFSF
jgi:electron transport complex protein RnfA